MSGFKTRQVIEKMHAEMVEKYGQSAAAVGSGSRQVFLRWVGVRMGVYFAAAATGPWDVEVRGGTALLDADDRVELEREREGLEKHSRASGLGLELAEVGEGSVLGAWRPVSAGLRSGDGPGVGAGPDVCRCQCEAGGACSRTVCSGAAALARDVKAVADETTGANWGMSMERVRALCIQTLAAEEAAQEETPLKRAAGLAVDFVAAVAMLDDVAACKAIDVLKKCMAVHLLARIDGKAVARG